MFNMQAYLVSDLGGVRGSSTWFVDEDSALRAIGRHGGKGTVREHEVSYSHDHDQAPTIGEPKPPAEHDACSGTSASMTSTPSGCGRS